MDNIKDFETFVNEGIFTNGLHRKNRGIDKRENIESLLEEFCNRSLWFGDHRNRDDYFITSKGFVNCKQTVQIFPEDLINGKLPFKFFKVKDFYIYNCKGLTSLEGCPRKVLGDFDCDGNSDITSLEGCPKEVRGDFNCSGCEKLTSLKGCPQKVGGDFNCRECGCEFKKAWIEMNSKVKGRILV